MEDIISAKEKEFNSHIFIIADDPMINCYDGIKVPSIPKYLEIRLLSIPLVSQYPSGRTYRLCCK